MSDKYHRLADKTFTAAFRSFAAALSLCVFTACASRPEQITASAENQSEPDAFVTLFVTEDPAMTTLRGQVRLFVVFPETEGPWDLRNLGHRARFFVSEQLPVSTVVGDDYDLSALFASDEFAPGEIALMTVTFEGETDGVSQITATVFGTDARDFGEDFAETIQALWIGSAVSEYSVFRSKTNRENALRLLIRSLKDSAVYPDGYRIPLAFP